MAGSMERLYELPPRIIHELDEELPVGVLGLDNWGYITMGPDRNPDSMPSDGWGLFHPPEYYYYMDPPSTTTTPVTTESDATAVVLTYRYIKLHVQAALKLKVENFENAIRKVEY